MCSIMRCSIYDCIALNTKLIPSIVLYNRYASLEITALTILPLPSPLIHSRPYPLFARGSVGFKMRLNLKKRLWKLAEWDTASMESDHEISGMWELTNVSPHEEGLVESVTIYKGEAGMADGIQHCSRTRA